MWDLIVSVPDHCLSFYFNCVLFRVTMFQTVLPFLNATITFDGNSSFKIWSSAIVCQCFEMHRLIFFIDGWYFVANTMRFSVLMHF